MVLAEDLVEEWVVGLMAGRGFGRGALEKKMPPAGYICHRCKVPGHFIQHCPKNADPNYDIKRVKLPVGIPRSMLMATLGSSYTMPSGVWDVYPTVFSIRCFYGVFHSTITANSFVH